MARVGIEIGCYSKKCLGGLLENMFWVFITNALVAPSITYFDPLYYWKLFNQYLAERKGSKNKLTQMEANV